MDNLGPPTRIDSPVDTAEPYPVDTVTVGTTRVPVTGTLDYGEGPGSDLGTLGNSRNSDGFLLSPVTGSVWNSDGTVYLNQRLPAGYGSDTGSPLVLPSGSRHGGEEPVEYFAVGFKTYARYANGDVVLVSDGTPISGGPSTPVSDPPGFGDPVADPPPPYYVSDPPPINVNPGHNHAGEEPAEYFAVGFKTYARYANGDVVLVSDGTPYDTAQPTGAGVAHDPTGVTPEDGGLWNPWDTPTGTGKMTFVDSPPIQLPSPVDTVDPVLVNDPMSLSDPWGGGSGLVKLPNNTVTTKGGGGGFLSWFAQYLQ